VVMPNAVIGAGVHIGMSCVINNCASVAHDSKVDDYASINDGCRIGGSVEIGSMAYLGMGAVVLPKIKIGASSVVGAGSVVTKDVPGDVTVAGVPAREIRRA
jgi:acetyltransferase-like isoleucine patch superfamily enzyme